MSGLRRSAILLLSLEKPLAASVMQLMPRQIVEQLTYEIAELGDVTRAEQDAVLDQFYQAAESLTQIERGSLEFATDLLRQSLGDDGAGEILDNVRQSIASVPFGLARTHSPVVAVSPGWPPTQPAVASMSKFSTSVVVPTRASNGAPAPPEGVVATPQVASTTEK